jgi:P-type Cu2+ transporter
MIKNQGHFLRLMNFKVSLPNRWCKDVFVHPGCQIAPLRSETKLLICKIVEDKTCKHCGAPHRDPSDFCCKGCDYVYHLIQDEGLDRYYELKDRTIAPVGTRAFQECDESALREHWLKSEIPGPGIRLQHFSLRGISCIGCVWLVEKLFLRSHGANQVWVSPQQGSVTIEATDAFDLIVFASEVQRFGYTLAPSHALNKESESAGTIRRRLGICAFLAMNTMGFILPFYLGMDWHHDFAPTLRMLAVVLATFSVLIGGTYFFRRAWAALRMGSMHIDLPIALGIAVAYTGSWVGWYWDKPELFYFDFVAVFTVLMLLGRWVQERITNHNIHFGNTSDPSKRPISRIYEDHHEEPIAIDSLQPGFRYRVEPGQWIPVQSRLAGGSATLSLESIHGESEPVHYVMGDAVPAGAILLSRSNLILEATEAWSASLFRKLLGIGERSVEPRSAMEQVLTLYIGTVIVIALSGFAAWGWFADDWKRAIQVAVSVLVVSCPCAIGLAYPLINDRCAQWLRGRGVFLRLHAFWSRLPRVRHVFFDKTGTLTMEMLELKEAGKLDALPETSIQALFDLVAQNLHPIGRSLKAHLLSKYPSLNARQSSIQEIREQVGFGVSLQREGFLWYLGKNPESHSPHATAFTRNGMVLALLDFEERLREDAVPALAWLKQHGYRVSVLSGDRPDKVESVIATLGISPDAGIGGMTPEAKASWIRNEAPATGMMVGDGANDALAFESALCRATPVIGRGILEQQADFFFLGKGIQGVIDVFRLAPLRGRVVMEVLTLTITYNLTVVGVSLLGWMSPLLAAVLMPLSSIVTVSWAGSRLSEGTIAKQVLRDQ